MSKRFFQLASAIALLALPMSQARAAPYYSSTDPLVMQSGGAPITEMLRMFGIGGNTNTNVDTNTVTVSRSDRNAYRTGPIARTTVSFPNKYKPGTIIVNSSERRLYLVIGEGRAIRYGIGVGRDGFRWSGVHQVSAKKEWPDWTPPVEMIRRQPGLPRHMNGGINNPLGARAIYIGSTLYRIHGSNEPETIGHAVSSGCFRMTNDDVKDLYNRVSIGSTVIVQR